MTKGRSITSTVVTRPEQYTPILEIDIEESTGGCGGGHWAFLVADVAVGGMLCVCDSSKRWWCFDGQSGM